jgi:hypothetical protein
MVEMEMQQDPQKRWYISIKPDGFMFQMTVILILTVMVTSKL